MFDFAVLAIGRADQADRITAVALNFEMKWQRFAFNGHQISIINSIDQVQIIKCMATNEMRNGRGSSIEAVLASNHKRRCVTTAISSKSWRAIDTSKTPSVLLSLKRRRRRQT